MKRMYLEERSGKATRVFRTLVEIAVVSALGLFLALFLFSSSKTESKSMEPTIRPSSVVFTDRIVYSIREPKRFDVISFTRKEHTESSDLLVRRIVGLPGDRIKIQKGTVYINDIPLDLSKYTQEITSDGIAGEEIRLKENEFFVLGDTPANSEDSRSSTIGVVNRYQIRGKAWLGAKSITQIYIIK